MRGSSVPATEQPWPPSCSLQCSPARPVRRATQTGRGGQSVRGPGLAGPPGGGEEAESHDRRQSHMTRGRVT